MRTKTSWLGEATTRGGIRLLVVHFEAALAFPYPSQEMPPLLEQTHFSLHLGCREPLVFAGCG